MRNIAIVAAICAAMGAAPPAPVCGALAVEGPTTVKAHRMVRLKATGYPVGAAILWDVYPDDKADVEERGDTLLMAAPPGRYTVKVRAILSAGGKTEASACRVTVTIEGDAPASPPATPPATPPDKGKADPSAATGAIQFGSSGCTATIVWPRRADGRWDILTASHCVSRLGQEGMFRSKDKKTYRVRVEALDRKADLCWLVTVDKVESLPYAKLAVEVPKVGAKVWHNGFGVDKPGNIERGEVVTSEDGNRQTAFRLSVSSGDSGGGIFREDTGELLAAVCCTKAKGRTAPMWGGSCTRAAELRPK